MAGEAVTVLVVDDEADVGEMIVDLLKEIGYETLFAPSGDAALEVLRGSSVDVVISDIVMPGMAGPDFVELMRRKGFSQPVIIYTGFPPGGMTWDLKGLNITGLLTKPFSETQLQSAINKALRAV